MNLYQVVVKNKCLAIAAIFLTSAEPLLAVRNLPQSDNTSQSTLAHGCVHPSLYTSHSNSSRLWLICDPDLAWFWASSVSICSLGLPPGAGKTSALIRIISSVGLCLCLQARS